LGEEVSGENNQQADKAIEHLFLGSLDFGGIAKAGQIGEGGENEAEEKVEPGQADGKKKEAGNEEAQKSGRVRKIAGDNVEIANLSEVIRH